MNKLNRTNMKLKSIEHRSDFVVECLIVQVVNLDGLEVFLRVEVAFGDKEGLSQNQLLNYNG